MNFDNDEVGKTLKSILDEKELVFIGLSSNPQDFSRAVYKEFMKRNYALFPVNPKLDTVYDKPAYKNIEDIDHEVKSAYMIVNLTRSLEITKKCHEKGINKIWYHRGVGEGSVSKEALEYCKNNGIEVVPGACPMMMFEDTMFLHKVHGWFRKRKGNLPVLPI